MKKGESNSDYSDSNGHTEPVIIEPWQYTVNRAILEHERKKQAKKVRRVKNAYIDVGKENRFMMWARLDMSAYEKVIIFCRKLGLDLDQFINQLIRFALDYYGETGMNKYQEYVKYIHGQIRDYRPLMISAYDVENYFAILASKYGLICD